MDWTWTVLRLLALVAGAAGFFYLLKEVWFSHQAEIHQTRFRRLERISMLMGQGQWIQAYAQIYRLDDGDNITIDHALEVARELGQDRCKDAVEASWAKKGLASQMDAAMGRWMALNSAAGTGRRWKLWLGTALVSVGLLLQVVGLSADQPAPSQIAIAPPTSTTPAPVPAPEVPPPAPPLVAADVNEPTPLPPADKIPRPAPVPEPEPTAAVAKPVQEPPQPAPEPTRAQETTRQAVSAPIARPKKEVPKKESKPLPRRSLRFDPGQVALRYTVEGRKVDLTDEVCAIKKDLIAEKPASVLVIARGDSGELSQALKRKYESKTAFAQARADAVAQYLSAKNECGAALNAVGTSVTKPRKGDQDRIVQVFSTPKADSGDTARK